ncbi:MAG TPA: hypothetical protein VMS17_13935 [Gemmataceae bacterium]|nr:hypothetical protein [Gemmataceae bacterium]
MPYAAASAFALSLAGTAPASSVPDAPISGATVETVDVLVARQYVEPWTSVQQPQALFMKVPFGKGSQPTDAVSSYEEVQGECLKHKLSAGQVLRKSSIAPKAGRSWWPAPPKRLYVKVVRDPQQPIHAKDRVDIVFTRPNAAPQILLKDQLLLSVDPTLNDDNYLSASFSVKPEQAQQLDLAQSLGELRLVVHAKDK